MDLFITESEFTVVCCGIRATNSPLAIVYGEFEFILTFGEDS